VRAVVRLPVHDGERIPYAAPHGVSGAPWKETLAFQNRGFGAKIPRAVQRQYQRSEDGQAPPHAMELAIDAANRYLPLAAIFAMLRQLAASRHHRSEDDAVDRPRAPDVFTPTAGDAGGSARALMGRGSRRGPSRRTTAYLRAHGAAAGDYPLTIEATIDAAEDDGISSAARRTALTVHPLSGGSRENSCYCVPQCYYASVLPPCGEDKSRVRRPMCSRDKKQREEGKWGVTAESHCVRRVFSLPMR
jgi:hypothetical protein